MVLGGGAPGRLARQAVQGLLAIWRSTGLAKLKSQTFIINGTFNVPVGVSAVMISATGGGCAGGGYFAGTGNAYIGAGASAEFCLQRKIPVTSGGTLPIVVGSGGIGQNGLVPKKNLGSISSYGAFELLCAIYGNTLSSDTFGGGPNGGTWNPPSNGTAESVSYFGGNGGQQTNAFHGPPALGLDGIGSVYDIRGVGGVGSGSNNGGSGGSGNVWPKAGDGGVPSATGGNATGWGAGGGNCGNGPGTANGGNGMSGAVVVYWVA